MSDETLFHLALEKPAAERPAFLEGACAGDVALRLRVEALLRSHETPDSFLVGAAENQEATTDSSTGQRAARQYPDRKDDESIVLGATVEGPGSRIGPYKLLQPIGEGGMGTVFMAEQAQPVRRTVALKLIKAGMDSRQVLARFGAERQALALMDHPSIAKVFDAGTTENGRPYFVMELVKGIPITKFCDERRLTLRERLELAIPVCQAVQHAHQKGIIHRDLKPSNVLIALYDGQPVPKVIDFGVAKATGPRLTDQTLYTEFGAVVGTLEYMSPEQAELNQLDIDTRSDIYSLGVLLYELLTGSTPLEHKRLKAVLFLEVLRLIRDEESPRPSMRLSTTEELPSIAACRNIEPRKLSGLMRGELDWIVMKALEKDRNRRYETANGLAADLRRYLDDEPVQACPPSAIYSFRKFARRNRAMLAMATVVTASLLAVALALAVSNVLINKKQREILREQSTVIKANALLSQKNEEILNERDAATRAAAIAEAINKFLTVDLLGEASPDRNARDQKVTVEELLARAARKIDSSKVIGQQPEVEAEIRDAIGTTYHKLGMPKAALVHLQKAIALRSAAFGPEHRQTLAAQEHLADFLNLGLHRSDLAEPLSYQTWQARRRVLGPEHPDTLDSLDTNGVALTNLLKLDEAEARLSECLEARKRVLGEEHRDTLTTLNNLSIVFQDQGKLDKAIKMARLCLKLSRKNDGIGALHMCFCINNLSKFLFLAGELGEAESLMREGLKATRKTLGPEHHRTIHSQYMLSQILLDEGKLNEAETLGRETLALFRRVAPAGDELIGRSLLILGRTLLEQGQAVEAAGMLRESADLFREYYKTRSDLISTAHCWQGAALAQLGKFTEAEPLLVVGYKNYVNVSSVPPRDKEKIRKRIVKMYEAWGKPEKAAEWRAIVGIK